MRGRRCPEVPRPGPGEGYRDMVDLIGTVADPAPRAMLSVAIRGPGAFRRSRDVLLEFPEERCRWFGFKEARTREGWRTRASGWSGGEPREGAPGPDARGSR